MGNALRFLFSKCCGPQKEAGAPPPTYQLGPHGVTTSTVGVSALAQDILHFDATSQVPDRLDSYVASSRKAQANWYRKLSVAWKEANPPPRDSKGAATLVIRTFTSLESADLQGFLLYYGLPPLVGVFLQAGSCFDDVIPQAGRLSGTVPPSLPQGVKLQFETLPVDAKSVPDGDGVNVLVDTADPREADSIPPRVRKAVNKRATARLERNYPVADEFQKTITDAGYRMTKGQDNKEVLARRYRIRLRGIDAPECEMPYGMEAKKELIKLVQGKCLKIQVYDVDQFERYVADVYCDKTFVQEAMLKRGCAWHYARYDKRPQFAMWEKQARVAHRGLWALDNPEKPWEWRKNRRNEA